MPNASAAGKAARKKENSLTIVEVSPRDGLPEVCGGLSTENKINYINKLSETGLKKIECASFTHPRLLPEGYDAEKLVAGIAKKPEVTYVGLVPNEIGCRRALVTQIDELLVLLSASDTFNRINLGKSLKESLNKVMPTLLDAAVRNARSVRIYLMTAFGCPYTGPVRPGEVAELLLKLSYMGASEVVLVDSTGMADPKSVKELIRTLRELKLDIQLAVHFHNTRGMAIANCVAAYEAGIRIFDASLGGMSNTPYGVSELDIGYWNVPTEDLVHLFEAMGIQTGIDLEKLLDCVRLAEKMAGKPLPGHILRAHPASHITDIPKKGDWKKGDGSIFH
ncbi:MAG: hydroxymethylglutaryl-CoA lyase [Smithellaceae bacterium]|nr:hydroxymethylglutaryl-CoA lyase [Smithellaceae bacterium]